MTDPLPPRPSAGPAGPNLPEVQRSMAKPSLFLGLTPVLFALLAACAAPDAANPKATPVGVDLSTVRPFTTRFLESTAVIAEEISVEGPSDLLHHIAIRQDPESTIFTTRTTPDGLLQEIVLRDDLVEGVGGRELRAELDGWTLVALRRMTVLQRPGDVPVLLRAVGDAAILPTHGEARRGPSLTVRGEHGTP